MGQGKPILRVGKIKSTGTATPSSVDGHLSRTRPTPNSDPARRSMNKILHGDGRMPLGEAIQQAYKRFKIDPEKLRADAVLANDIVMSVSPVFFRPDAPDHAGTFDKNRLESFQNEAMIFLKKSFGNRLIRVDLHLDESTPHIHAIVVPVLPSRDKSHFRLSSKDMFAPDKLVGMQDGWERAMSQHGVGERLKGSKAQHSKLRDFYAAVDSFEVEKALGFAISDPPEKGIFQSEKSHKDEVADWKKQEQKRLRAEIRPLAASAAKGRLYDVERLTAEAARSDAEASRQRLASIFQDFGRVEHALDLSKAEIARLRTLKIKDVAEHLGYDGPVGPKENAIDLIMRVAEIDFKGATAWLHQNMGEDAMQAAVAPLLAAQTPSEAIWTKADRAKKTQIEKQLDALDAPEYRVTIMRAEGAAGESYNFGKRVLSRDGMTKAEIIAAIPHLGRDNARSGNVFITPLSATHHYVLWDDLKAARLSEMREQGYHPATLTETSPGNFQAVLKIPRAGTNSEALNVFFKDLNKARGDDRIVGLEHPFRLAGFTNRKEKHRTENGFPFVRLREAVNQICDRSIAMVREYTNRIIRDKSREKTPSRGYHR